MNCWKLYELEETALFFYPVELWKKAVPKRQVFVTGVLVDHALFWDWLNSRYFSLGREETVEPLVMKTKDLERTGRELPSLRIRTIISFQRLKKIKCDEILILKSRLFASGGLNGRPGFKVLIMGQFQLVG